MLLCRASDIQDQQGRARARAARQNQVTGLAFLLREINVTMIRDTRKYAGEASAANAGFTRSGHRDPMVAQDR